MVQRSPLAIGLLGLLSAVAGIHLWAQWISLDNVAEATQWLLMPLLAGALFLDTRRPDAWLGTRLVRLTLVALFFSWLGDSLPRLVSENTAFLLMMGCFLAAQIAYIAAFRPYLEHSVLHVGRIALAPYVVGVIVLAALCFTGAGPLLIPVLVYGVVLGAMAVLATGVNGLVWAGGTVFLTSDALIALGEFSEVNIAHNGFWVMLTYVVAQVLIVLGVEQQADATATG